MFIPIQAPARPFEVARARTERLSPLAPVAAIAASVGGGDKPVTFGEPLIRFGGRDVGTELDRLLSSLAPASSERRSASRLSLDRVTPEARSRLSSFAELNPAATSFEKTHLTFGASTSSASVSGTYAGTGAAAGVNELELRFTDNATVGSSSSPLRFQVLDENGGLLYTFDGSAKAGQPLSLGADIGLWVTFAAGSAVAGESARLAVSADEASHVDPDARFADDDLNARPRFEGGASVIAGSFRINGFLVEVKSEDSINAVLARINTFVPGITATFTDDRVELATRDPSSRAIVVSDDSSGFLSATKLRGAVTVSGQVHGDQELLLRTGHFAFVKAGSFLLNGVEIAVDPTRDSLQAILRRIEASQNGVTAFLDPASGKVVVRGRGAAGVILSGDTSGFLAAAGLAEGESPPVREPFSLSPGAAQKVELGVEGLRAKALARTLDGLAERLASPKETPEALASKAKYAYQTEKNEPRTTEFGAADRATASFLRPAPIGPTGVPAAAREAYLIA